MRKLAYFAVVVAAAGLVSCNAQSPKASFNNDIDTLSYMIGIESTQGLEMYMYDQLGIDSANVADFMRGIQDGMNKTAKKDMAYMNGVQIGQQVASRMVDAMNQRIFMGDSVRKLNKTNIFAGFMDAIKKRTTITPDSAAAYENAKGEEIRAQLNEERYGENKAAGEKFLEENAKQEGVQVTPSGLQYKILQQGKGPVPTEKSKVKVHYRGTLVDGTEFDSSYSRKEPAEFSPNGVIPGWKEALLMMPVGSKWMIYVPQELGYGAKSAGAKINPFSALIFEVELLDVEEPK